MLLKSNKKGFTLVELIITIAVIAVLASVAIISFADIIKSGNTAADVSAAKSLNHSLNSAVSDIQNNTVGETAGKSNLTADSTVAEVMVADGLVENAADTAAFFKLKQSGKVLLYDIASKTVTVGDSDEADETALKLITHDMTLSDLGLLGAPAP